MLEDLQMKRPIAFIDVETTGTIPNVDRIVELSVYKLHPDGREEYKSHRFNPGMHIPAEATAVHHITDSDVADESRFARYAKSIKDFLDGCDIGGFNVIKFDLPCLEAEFARAGVEFSHEGRCLIDSMVIFHLKERRDLEAAYRMYCGKEMENAHNAQEDAKASAAVLAGQLKMYEDLPRDVESLDGICNIIPNNYVDSGGRFIWVEGEVVCNFSKENKGRRLADLVTENPGFLRWVLERDFSPEAKDIVRKAMSGEFPNKE